jgi:hypothetical protein
VTARTPAEAIAAVHRHGPAITAEERGAALRLLEDMLAAAAVHGITYEDFAWVTGLADACVDVVVAKTRRG